MAYPSVPKRFIFRLSHFVPENCHYKIADIVHRVVVLLDRLVIGGFIVPPI